MDRTTLSLALLALLTLFSTGCSSLAGYRYAPSSAEVSWADPEAEAPWVRSLAQLTGLREVDDAGWALARVRVENPGVETVQLVESGFSLLDGRLAAFGSPSIKLVTGDAWSVPPGSALVVELQFPFPAGDPDEIDFESLTFGWAIRRGVKLHPTSTVFERTHRRANFRRLPSRFYDPYCSPYGYGRLSPYGFGFAYGFGQTY